MTDINYNGVNIYSGTYEAQVFSAFPSVLSLFLSSSIYNFLTSCNANEISG